MSAKAEIASTQRKATRPKPRATCQMPSTTTTRPSRKQVSRAGTVTIGMCTELPVAESWKPAFSPASDPLPSSRMQSSPSTISTPPTTARRRGLTGTSSTSWTTRSSEDGWGGTPPDGGTVVVLIRSTPSR